MPHRSRPGCPGAFAVWASALAFGAGTAAAAPAEPQWFAAAEAAPP